MINSLDNTSSKMQSTIESSNRQIQKVLKLNADQNMVRHKLN